MQKMIVFSFLFVCSLSGMEYQYTQPASRHVNYLFRLPPELIVYVAKFLPQHDAVHVRKTCHFLHGLFWDTNRIIKISPARHLKEKAHHYWQRVRKYVRQVEFLKEHYIGHNPIAVNLHVVNIQAIAKRLKALKHIIELNLANNSLENLSKGIAHLTQLRKLNVHNNLLYEGTIVKLSKLHLLKELNLGKNLLIKLPREFSQLSQLHSLDLSENNLSPTGINPICSLPSLIRLNLSGSVKHGITPAIANLVTLQELIISSNNLTPEQIEWFCRLLNLRLLDAHNNQITYLPMAFANLSRLRSLILSQNPITSDGIGPVESLTNLKELDISSCPTLHTFYDGIAQALPLERLNIQGTDIPLAHVQPLLAHGTQLVHD